MWSQTWLIFWALSTGWSYNSMHLSWGWIWFLLQMEGRWRKIILLYLLGRASHSSPFHLKKETNSAFETFWRFSLRRWIISKVTVKSKICSFLVRIWVCPPYHMDWSAEKQDQYVPSWSCSQAVSKPVWHIPLLCVQWKTPDDGQRNCPKYVEFYSKNKFE